MLAVEWVPQSDVGVWRPDAKPRLEDASVVSPSEGFLVKLDDYTTFKLLIFRYLVTDSVDSNRS